MNGFPRILVDLEKLEDNSRAICDLARDRGISVAAVTKATCGDPRVARAMLKGGADLLADSRLDNIKRMKKAGIGCPMMLLRSPMPSETDDVVEHVDMSINTDPGVISDLSRKAISSNRVHGVILMVEMGDLREGVPRDRVSDLVTSVLGMEGVELLGIGMNLACFAGVVPTRDKIDGFEQLVTELESTLGHSFEMISGGNSANIPLLLKKDHGNRINNLRIGEGILLGLETVNRTAIPNTHQDAFIVQGELIEVYEKHSVPDGQISQNAYGETPTFPDRGIFARGIVALGRQDVKIDGLRPVNGELEILGGSSDHILVRVGPEASAGDVISFIPNYGSLVSAFTSGYVKKEYR